MLVQNMESKKGNKIANQFIVEDNDCIYFQSYNSIIVKKVFIKDNIAGINYRVLLDEYYWNYSTTTSKYRNLFLDETTKETQEKINKGIYTLTNLN